MERRLAVRGIIYKDGKLFAVRQMSQDKVSVNDFWCTLGGGVDQNEALLAAVEREFIEETGIKPEVGGLLYVQQYVDSGLEQLEFFFHIKNVRDYETIDIEQTTHGHIELTEFDFIDPKTSNILPKFLRETDIASDIETGSPQFFSYF